MKVILKDIKAIENILFSYKEIPLKVRKLELEIKIIESTYETIKGRQYNRVMEGSQSNRIGNSVEEALMNKENRINEIRMEIKQILFNKEMIDIAMENLTEIERKIIEDKYFNKLSYYKLGEKYYFSKEWAFQTCIKIIKDKIEPYIIKFNCTST